MQYLKAVVVKEVDEYPHYQVNFVHCRYWRGWKTCPLYRLVRCLQIRGRFIHIHIQACIGAIQIHPNNCKVYKGSNVQCYILHVHTVPYPSYIDPCASVHSFSCFIQLLSSENEVTLPIHIH